MPPKTKTAAATSEPLAADAAAETLTLVHSRMHFGLDVLTVQTPKGPSRVDPGSFVCTMSDGSVVGVHPSAYDAFAAEHAAQ